MTWTFPFWSWRNLNLSYLVILTISPIIIRIYQLLGTEIRKFAIICISFLEMLFSKLFWRKDIISKLRWSVIEFLSVLHYLLAWGRIWIDRVFLDNLFAVSLYGCLEFNMIYRSSLLFWRTYVWNFTNNLGIPTLIINWFLIGVLIILN
jgi:hypothetical protein